MLEPITTNMAREMIQESLGIPKVSLEGVQMFFTCNEGICIPGEPKTWEQFREIKPEFIPRKVGNKIILQEKTRETPAFLILL
ncbi:MAG: hypothetical protein PHH98_02105 [Candidatus Gracilibacteria bacterium]|nr:hypothetical protein [Candidatus Gracilibacteria bacterium]